MWWWTRGSIFGNKGKNNRRLKAFHERDDLDSAAGLPFPLRVLLLPVVVKRFVLSIAVRRIPGQRPSHPSPLSGRHLLPHMAGLPPKNFPPKGNVRSGLQGAEWRAGPGGMGALASDPLGPVRIRLEFGELSRPAQRDPLAGVRRQGPGPAGAAALWFSPFHDFRPLGVVAFFRHRHHFRGASGVLRGLGGFLRTASQRNLERCPGAFSDPHSDRYF